MRTRIDKPIFYYSVMTGNRGDIAIRKSICHKISNYLDIPFTFFNLKYEELTEERIVNQLNVNASALIVAGSGLYSNYKHSSGWYFPCKTELFKKIEVPIFLIGIGSNENLKGDFLNSQLKNSATRSIKLINNLAKTSTVRDLRTYKILKNIGIKKHKVILDPANFLECNFARKQKRVAIQIAQHAPILGRFDASPEGKEVRRNNILQFSKISNYLKGMGYEIVFIAHDALESSLIADLKCNVKGLQYLNTDNIQEMLRMYSSCEFSIGMKMHSNILSFASGTPFISLYYDIKSVEYLKMIDWSEFGKSVFSNYYSWLETKTNKIIQNNVRYSRFLARKKCEELINFETHIKEICDIIKIIN